LKKTKLSLAGRVEGEKDNIQKGDPISTVSFNESPYEHRESNRRSVLDRTNKKEKIHKH
jgi:hypothetical protein